MFGIFRRPVVEAIKPFERLSPRKPAMQPVNWQEQFAPIPQAEVVEGNDDLDWTLWDESVSQKLDR